MAGDKLSDLASDLGAGEALPPEYTIALNYTPAAIRGAAACYLALDRRLAQIVGQITEPMLGQMRLTWWRDMLGVPVSERPKGDAVLTQIGEHWHGQELALIALVDAWEEMLSDPPLPRDAALRFAKGRAAGFIALAQMQKPSTDLAKFAPIGQAWALVDAAVHISDVGERDMLFELAKSIDRTPRTPPALRGAAVLDALARRSLMKSGAPLMEGRGAALTALRAGLLG
jgi:phytoene synthase